MEQFLIFTITGLSLAAVYAVAASGLVLTYTTTGIFNFAHGAIGMLGVLTYWQLRVDWAWPAPIALAVVLLVVMPLLGVFLELVIWRGLQGTAESTRLVVSVSLLVASIGLAQWIWPPEARRVTQFFQGNRVDIGPVFVTWHEAITIGVAIAVAIGLRFLLYRTRAGIAMRAAVDDRPLSSLNGARPDRVAMLAWAVGCSLAALGGILLAPTRLDPTILSLLIVNAYAAAMIGRLRSLPLTFLGAVILGLADAYAIGYLPENQYLSTFRTAIPVIILFAVLLLLRQHRLRGHTADRAREHFPKPSMVGAALGGLAVVAIAAGLAQLATPSDTLTLARVFAIAIIALSFVPLVGYAGQISLAQLSFAGIGAIVMSHWAADGSPLGLLYAAVVAGAVGALVALPALRLSGIYLALATAAFAVVLDLWVFKLPEFTVLGVDVNLFPSGALRVPRLEVGGVSFQSEDAQLVLLATVFSLLALLVVGIRRSKFGQRLVAMKDSEAACATLGMNLTGTKLAVFALSAAIAGVGGALLGGLNQSVDDSVFAFSAGLPFFMMTVVGGIGAVGGALFAGIALAGIAQLPSIVPSLTNPMLVAPGLLGITLGRNPSGVVRDLGERWSPVVRVPAVLVVLVLVEGGLLLLAVADVIDSWPWFLASIVALVLAPTVAEALEGRSAADGVADASPDDVVLEWVGIERPFRERDRHDIDRALGVSEVELRGTT